MSYYDDAASFCLPHGQPALTGLFRGLDNSPCTEDTACARYSFNIKQFEIAPVLCFHIILALELL